MFGCIADKVADAVVGIVIGRLVVYISCIVAGGDSIADMVEAIIDKAYYCL